MRFYPTAVATPLIRWFAVDAEEHLSSDMVCSFSPFWRAQQLIPLIAKKSPSTSWVEQHESIGTLRRAQRFKSQAQLISLLKRKSEPSRPWMSNGAILARHMDRRLVKADENAPKGEH